MCNVRLELSRSVPSVARQKCSPVGDLCGADRGHYRFPIRTAEKDRDMKKTLPRIDVRSRYIPIVTLSMIVFLILCFYLETMVGATYSSTQLASLFSVSLDTIRSGHLPRLFTANLFHVNRGHLQSNIAGLLFFSSLLEIIVGRSRAAVVILLSALGGTIGSLLFHIVDWMVGSSTILFGVFGGIGVLVFKNRRTLHRHFLLVAISWCVSLILLSTLGYLSLQYVDQGAHIGGIAAGILATWLLTDAHSSAEERKPLSFRARAALIVLIAVFGISFIKEVVLPLPMLL